MTWNDFLKTSHCGYDSIGVLDKTQYVFVHRVQSHMVSQFYAITKQEYDDYIQWKQNQVILDSICSRPILYKGFWGTSEFSGLSRKVCK